MDLLQKLLEHGVGFGGPLLLQPVPGALENHGAAVVAAPLFDAGDRFLAPPSGDVVLRPEKERWNLELPVGMGLEIVPTLIDVAVVVEPAR